MQSSKVSMQASREHDSGAARAHMQSGQCWSISTEHRISGSQEGDAVSLGSANGHVARACTGAQVELTTPDHHNGASRQQRIGGRRNGDQCTRMQRIAQARVRTRS